MIRAEQVTMKLAMFMRKHCTFQGKLFNLLKRWFILSYHSLGGINMGQSKHEEEKRKIEIRIRNEFLLR